MVGHGVDYLVTNREELVFPIFVIHSDNIDYLDGILWLDDQVLDDKNMKGRNLGIRRLQSPMKSLYPLKYMIQDEVSLMKHRAKTFIDSTGRVFHYEKTEKVDIIYHKIVKREKKTLATVIWCKDCPFPFDEKSPPKEEFSWAGVIYRSGIPWKVYEYSETYKKKTWRKI